MTEKKSPPSKESYRKNSYVIRKNWRRWSEKVEWPDRMFPDETYSRFHLYLPEHFEVDLRAQLSYDNLTPRELLLNFIKMYVDKHPSALGVVDEITKDLNKTPDYREIIKETEKNKSPLI